MARLAVESTDMTEEEFEAWCNRYITIPFGEGVFHRSYLVSGCDPIGRGRTRCLVCSISQRTGHLSELI